MDALNDPALTGGFENVFGFYNNSYFIKGRATGWDEGREEGRKEGRKEGREEERKERRESVLFQIRRVLANNYDCCSSAICDKVAKINDVKILDSISIAAIEKTPLETIEKRIDDVLEAQDKDISSGH